MMMFDKIRSSGDCKDGSAGSSLQPCDNIDAMQRIQREREKMMAELDEKMAKVREADRILEEANEKVRAMKKRDLTELCRYSQPPPLRESSLCARKIFLHLSMTKRNSLSWSILHVGTDILAAKQMKHQF